MTESNENDFAQMGVRVPKEMHAQFFTIADRMGMSASALMRELVVGLIEGRVTIAPPKHLSDLYSMPTTKEI